MGAAATSGGAGVPAGFRLQRESTMRVTAGGTVLTGGTPWTLLRLTETGAARAARLLGGAPVADAADAALARRLLAAGLAHPRPPRSPEIALEVVVPVRDRAADLDRCLDTLHLGAAVVVVDDGSTDAAALASVSARHGARLVRRRRSGGPAAARNAGLAATTADLVAFVDSDALVPAETLRRLADHLADPAVAAVAPRVRPAPSVAWPARPVWAAAAVSVGPGGGVLARLGAARSPLDLGAEPALVRPGGRVGYAPTTVLVARRAAVTAAGGFDEALRYGEDVDLVWRLCDAGWSVRYDPACEARHREPASWSRWLARRFRYGSSAGPLARRHGARLAGPALAGLTAPVMLARLAGRGAMPAGPAVRLGAVAPARTLLALAGWATPLWWPVLLVTARRHRRARAGLAAAAVVPPLVEWGRRRPALDPLRWTAAALADDAAYGAGVWLGAVRARTSTPVLPRLRTRQGSAGDGRPGAHDEPRVARGP